MEFKQSTPSVIARLMGLDELPQTQKPVQKPKRVLSENYLQRVALIGAGKKHLFRMTTLEQKKQIKDDFQVVKTLKGDEHVEPSVEKGKANLGFSVMAFARKNSITAKCPSVNKKPQTLKDFQRSSELVDSRNGSLQTYIPNRSAFLFKPYHGVQASLPLANRNSTSIRRIVDTCRKPKRTETELEYPRPCQIFGNRSYVTCPPETEIVALKPMLVEKMVSGRYFSSLSFIEGSHSGDRRREKSSGSENGRVQVEVKENNNLECDVESVRQHCIASREILEKLSRRTRWRKTSISTKTSSLGFRDGKTFTTKSESSTPSICSFDSRNGCQPGSSTDKSSMAKMQFFERFPMSKKFEEVGLASKGRTLDELCASQDHDSRSRNHKPGSRRLGVKDPDLSKFAKQLRNEGFCSELYLRPNHSLSWARCKLSKQDFDQEGAEAKDLKLNPEKSKSLPCLDLKGFEMKNKLDDGDIYKQNMMLPKVEDVTVDAENNVAVEPSAITEDEQLEENDDFSSCTTDASVPQEEPIGFHEESSVSSRCFSTEPDSLGSLEEAYQPSPISVLEPPFSEEAIISSKFLGMVKDDICDSRGYLELLKSEALETYSDGPGMAVSSDDESEEGSAGHYKENEVNMKFFKVEESRNFSYLVDVFTEASLHGRNLEEFSKWHSPDCPISLSVFEILEKKYGDQMSWKRSERRLLFDCINEGLMKIICPCMGVTAWKKSVSRRFNAVRNEEMIVEDLWRLLVCQEKERSKMSEETVLGSELGKIDLGDEIDAIGTEIERLLFDELMAEFISMKSS